VLAALALVAWLAAAVPLGQFVGRLSSVAQNDAVAYLPVGAEATVVDRTAARFRDQDVRPTAVVYESPSALTSADLARIRADMAALAGLDLVSGAPRGPRVSDDRRAAEVLVQVRATGPTGAPRWCSVPPRWWPPRPPSGTG
jgi:putative drug exporter of the RND superfamily